MILPTKCSGVSSYIAVPRVTYANCHCPCRNFCPSITRIHYC